MYSFYKNWEKEDDKLKNRWIDENMLRSFFGKGNFREKIVIQEKKAKNEMQNWTISPHLQTNIDNINQILDKPEDLKMRNLQIGNSNIKCTIIFFEGIVDPISTQQSILDNVEKAKNLPDNEKEFFDYLFNKLIAINEVHKESNFHNMTIALLSGMTIFLIDGVEQGLIINTIGGNFRQIDEPITETLIRGPRDGFVENIQSNLALIRRGIRDPNLRFQSYTAGKRSKNNLVVAYVEGIIHPPLLEELDRRLKTMNTDVVPESGYIEEWIEDSFLSPF